MTAADPGGETARPATVNITSHATEIKVQHVWTDEDGDTNGALSFGASWIAVHSAQQARDIAAAATELAARMEAHTANHDGAR
jgi:hypothetical protein